jgi:molybdenum cofactor cytidylyltransferase
MNIDCLIPAAGFSSRMGNWKLTLPFKENTIIENSISNALSICNRVIIVSGHRASELKELLQENSKVSLILNKNFKKGMFSSIQAGVGMIRTEWFFISMGDMPEISEEIYKHLIEVKNINSNEFDIIRPLYHGKRGHPVLLNKNTIKSILKEPFSSEMKNVFSHFRVLEIEMNTAVTFADIDTPEDYKRIIDK